MLAFSAAVEWKPYWNMTPTERAENITARQWARVNHTMLSRKARLAKMDKTFAFMLSKHRALTEQAEERQTLRTQYRNALS